MPLPPAATVLQVYVFRDGEFVGSDVFVERQVIVGRDPNMADLVLESTQVSRQHAIIDVDGERISIRDSGSTNGVFLNEKEVDEAEIGRLDEIGIGEFTLKVKLVKKGARRDVDATVASDDRPQPRAHRDDAAPPKPRREPAAVAAAAAPRREEPAVALRSERAPEKKPPPSEASAPRRQPVSVDERALAEIGRPDTQLDVARTRIDLKKPELRVEELADEEPAEEEPVEESSTKEERSEPRGSDTGQVESQEADDPDDDDEDADFVPSYSLLERLLEERPVPTDGRQALRVLKYSGEAVEDVRLLGSGESYWVGPKLGLLARRATGLPPPLRLLRVRRPGECEVQYRSSFRTKLSRGRAEKELVAERSKKGVQRATLRPGEALSVEDGGHSYHVSFVARPQPIRDDRPLAERLKPSPQNTRSALGSFGFHLGAMLIIGIINLLSSPPEQRSAPTEEFVEVSLDAKLELEAAPPPEPEKPPEQIAASEKVPPNMAAAPSKKRPRAGGTSKGPPGVLGLLSKKGSSAAPGPAAAVAAVSNLNAARVPGNSSGYRVSGLLGKLPTSSLSVGGGGGGVMTKGGAALLRGGGGGGGVLSGNGTREVGGLVQKVPKAMRSAGQGTLDRDEIQKVINKNIGQIQRCYERELLQTPGLSGKVEIEWTVSTSGSVRGTRQSFSNLGSTQAVNCMLDSVRGWIFPRPKGGEVVVTYPFIFKPVGF